jgi:hypothetical protein
VRIHDHADRDAERRAEDHVRRFARHSRQREQFFHRARHFAAELFDDFLAAPMMDLVLFRKKPVGRISCSSSAGFAYAKSFGVRYFDTASW